MKEEFKRIHECLLQWLPRMVTYTFTMITMFFFTFGVPFSFLPVNTSKVILICITPIVAVHWVKKGARLALNKRLALFALFLIAMVIISMAYAVCHGTYDYHPAYSYSIFFSEALFGSVGIYFIFFKNKNFTVIAHFIVSICHVQSTIIILMFSFPSFRNIVFSITNTKALVTFERYGGFRGLGLAGSLTYDLAVFLSIGFMFALYLLIVKRKNLVYYSFSLLFMFVAILMTGRTGLIGIALSIIICVYSVRKKSTLKKAASVFTITALSCIILYSVLTAKYPAVINSFEEIVIPFAFEMILNFSENGNLNTTSTNNLKTMYFNVSHKSFWFGDGYWREPYGDGYYMSTDAGYMRHLLYYGLFPSMLLYLVYLIGFLTIINSIKEENSLKIVIGVIGLLFFLIHIKGDFLMGSAMNIKLFCLLYVYSCYQNPDNIVAYSRDY